MDFSAGGRYAIVSCEFSGHLLKIDVLRRRIRAVLHLPRRSAVPQDVRLSPDGRIFYVADMAAGGVWEIDGDRFRVIGFLRTGAGAHGLVVSRDRKLLYVANRDEGSISVVGFGTRRVVRKWWIPGGGSPDMGRLRRRQGALAVRSLRRRRVRHLDPQRKTAGQDPCRPGPTRTLRLAPTRPPLARPHRRSSLVRLRTLYSTRRRQIALLIAVLTAAGASVVATAWLTSPAATGLQARVRSRLRFAAFQSRRLTIVGCAPFLPKRSPA